MTNPLHSHRPGTLDESVIRGADTPKSFGWRWALVLAYLLLVIALTTTIITSTLGIFFTDTPLTDYFREPRLLIPAVFVLTFLLFLFRWQAGWVMATTLVAGFIVLSTIFFVIQYVPAIEPDERWRTSRKIAMAISGALACGVFYLLSHPRLRAGFRIPQSWTGHCVTLGGLIGTGVGLFLIWYFVFASRSG